MHPMRRRREHRHRECDPRNLKDRPIRAGVKANSSAGACIAYKL